MKKLDNKLCLLKSVRSYRSYKKQGVNALRQNFLNRIALNLSIVIQVPDHTLYKLLNKYATILELREVEISLWGLLLEQCSVSQTLCIRKLLLYTGYAAKRFFNSYSKELDAKLNYFIKNFSFKFNNWLLLVNLSEEMCMGGVSEKFQELSEPKVKPKPRLGHYEDLVTQMMPENEKRFFEMGEESDATTVTDLDNELEVFENTTMGGEKLSPIYYQSGLYT